MNCNQLKEQTKQKKLYHRVLALTLCFGMVLNLLLPVNFSIPVLRLFAEGELYFGSAQTTPPTGAVLITNYDYTVTGGGETFTKSSETPLEITVAPDTLQSIDLSLLMHYVFDNASVVKSIKDNGGYIYYRLPNNLSFDQSYFGSNSKVRDGTYANAKWGGADVPSGYYSIWNGVTDGEKVSAPLLVIHFTPDYVDYFSANHYLAGDIEFDGQVKRDNTVEGDQTVSFANGPEITVKFADDKVTVKKENATAKTDESGNKYLEWKITVYNPSGRSDLTGYTLSDTLNGTAFDLNATNANCTVTPSGDGSFVNGNYVFSGKTKGNYAEYYTFVYKQTSVTAATQYTNKATLTGGKEPASSEATGKIEDKLQVTKDGKPDYQDTGVRDDSINWTVTVENKSGDSLASDKVYLVDSAFANVKTGTLKVVDADGNTMVSGTDYEIINGKVYYNNNNNLTDITNVGNEIDPTGSLPQYIYENNSYIKINAITENKRVGFRGDKIYDVWQEITNYHISEDDVPYYTDSNRKIDITNLIVEDGKLYYKNGDGTKGDELTSYHKVKGEDAYYNNDGVIVDYCWMDDVLYTTPSTEHTTDYKVLVKDGKVYDIYSYNIENLTTSNQILNSSILQFKGTSATSSATITYSTAVTDLNKTSGTGVYTASSVSQYNKVYTGSDSENPPENTSWDKTVEYKNELKILKKAADDGFDEETETFKWKLKAYTNFTSVDSGSGSVSVDSSSKESIDGYIIEDAMFKNITADTMMKNFNCIMSDGTETTEYSKYVTISKESDTKIKITINKDLMATDEKTGIISGIELFYNTSAKDTLDDTTIVRDGKTQYGLYQDNQEVTAQNTATISKTDSGYSSSDGIGISAQTRFSATKQFTGNKETIVEQDVSESTKNLDWKISLIKDQGFNHDSVVLVDSLGTTTTNANNETVDTSNKVLHYLSAEQLAGIVLKGKTTLYGTETIIDSNLYTVTPTTKTITKDDETEEYVVGFQVKFNAGIDTANYHYIDLTYQTTANLQEVEAGWKTQFSNGCEFGDTNPTDTGITYELEDKENAKPTTLKINKTWVDADNVYQTRPTKIKVRVLQALVDSNEWKYVVDEAKDTTTTNVNEAKVFTVPVSSNMIVAEDFPQWKAITQEGTITTVRYQYKVEEIVEDGSAYTPSEVSAVTATGNNTTVNLTNTLTKAIYSKTANTPEMTTSQITKVTVKEKNAANIDVDVDYYVFKWKMDFNLTQDESSNTVRTFVDTMPNGFIYLTDAKCVGNLANYKTTYKYKDNTTANASNFAETYHTGESVSTSGNTITFKLRENISEMQYYTMIRKDEFERAVTAGVITNKVRLQESGETDHIATVKITDIPETDNENIKKMYQGGSQGTLRYALDFNPQGKKLSNTKYVDITDTLKYETKSNDTLDNLRFTLTNLKVYAYNPDGTTTELSKSDYRSSVSYSNVSDVQKLTVTNTATGKWSLEGWSAGDKVTIASSDDNIYYFKYSIQEHDSSNQITYHDFVVQGSASGSGSMEFTIGSDTQSIEIIREQGNATATLTAKKTITLSDDTLKNTPAILHIEVPDQKYLRIEYTYTVTGFTEAPENSNNQTNVIVSNTASFETENAAGYDKSDEDAMNVDHSTATSNTKTHPQIYKVDANSLSIDDLAAQFKVLKYDATNKKWYYASKIEQSTESGVTAREITFGTTEEGTTLADDTTSPRLIFTTPPDDGSAPIAANHNFVLDPNAIYKFIEVAAPSNYRPVPTSGTIADYDEFTFYFAYALEGNIPTELNSIKDKIVSVLQDGRFDIPNSKYVSISAKKQFSGKTEDIPSKAKATFELYWSYNRDGTELQPIASDFPIQPERKNGFSATMDVYYTTDGTNTVTWDGLPDGYNQKPVYYFVKETSYTILGDNDNSTEDDTTYTVNTDGTVSNGGEFKPIYINNGTNSDGDTIVVNNASGLVIKKEWQNLSGATISPPKEVNSTTNDIAIGFTLTAQKLDGTPVTLDINATLNATNNYEYAIEAGKKVTDTTGTQYSLSELKNFAILEKLTALQKSEIGDDYVFSPTYELSNNMGVIKLINTSTLPAKTTATVEKVWVGTAQPVSVQLYQTQTKGLTSEEISALTATAVGDVVTLNTNNDFTYTWSELDNADSTGKRYYYYVKETSTFTGVTTSYEVSVTNTEQKTTITNREEASIKVRKEWSGVTDAQKKPVVVELKYLSNNNWTSFSPAKTLSLNSTDGWEQSFVNLDKTDNNGNAISYRVFERSIDDETLEDSAVANADYRITYDTTSVQLNQTANQTITITNTLKEKVSIEVEKVWAGMDDLTASEKTAYQQNVTVDLMRSTDNSNWQKVDDYILKSSEDWEHTFTNLDKADDSNNPYYYKVVEQNVNTTTFNVGYSPQSVQFNDSQASKKITITNTLQTFKLKIQKIWGDEKTHNAVGVLLNRSTDSARAPSVTIIDDSQPETKNPFPYYNSENHLPSTLNKGDKVTITFSYTGEGTPSINGCLGGNGVDSNGNDTNWDTQGWSATIGNDGTATAEITLDRVIKNPQIQLWWVDGYSKMKEGSTTERADDDKTDYAPLSITSVTYTQKPQKTLNLTVDYQNSKTIEVDGTATLSPSWSDSSSVDSVEYEFSTDNSTWSSSSGVVSVSENTLTGTTAGTVYVRAKSEDVYSSSVQVTVKSYEKVKKSVTFSITPDNSTYDITEIDTSKKLERVVLNLDETFVKDLNQDYYGMYFGWNCYNASGNYLGNGSGGRNDILNIKTNNDYNISFSISKDEVAKVTFTLNSGMGEVKFSGYELVYEVPTSRTNQLPHRPTRSLPKIATPTDSTQYVLRLGNLVQAQQSAESQNTSISQVVTGTPKMRRMQANAASWQNVTLTSNGNWSEEITLPMYDTNGNKYYYWLAENSVPAGYTASYKFEGGGNSYCIDATATNPQITVKNTPLAEDSVTLPTSGGSGTAPYRTAGFLLMMTAVTFPYIKHRNRRKRNSA